MKTHLITRRSFLRSTVGTSFALTTLGGTRQKAFGATAKPTVLRLGHPDTVQEENSDDVSWD
jgi:hypothetical protein